MREKPPLLRAAPARSRANTRRGRPVVSRISNQEALLDEDNRWASPGPRRSWFTGSREAARRVKKRGRQLHERDVQDRRILVGRSHLCGRERRYRRQLLTATLCRKRRPVGRAFVSTALRDMD